jgi:hypothetical protein
VEKPAASAWPLVLVAFSRGKRSLLLPPSAAGIVPCSPAGMRGSLSRLPIALKSICQTTLGFPASRPVKAPGSNQHGSAYLTPHRSCRTKSTVRKWFIRSMYDCGVVGSIPTGGALEVWPWTFGFRTAWLINKSAGPPPFYTSMVVCIMPAQNLESLHKVYNKSALFTLCILGYDDTDRKVFKTQIFMLVCNMSACSLHWSCLDARLDASRRVYNGLGLMQPLAALELTPR